MAIDKGFFVVLTKEKNKWFSVVGTRLAIDKMFDWLCRNFTRDDKLWMSFLFHDQDAVVLDVIFFDEELSYNFQSYYQKDFIQDE